MNPPRIAIASPSANAWSETFIAAHLERLHGVELVLVDGELPTRVAGGPLLRGRTAPGRLADRLLALLRGTDPEGLVRHRIARLLQRRGIEVLLAEYGNCAHALIGPARAAKVPLVAHFHGFDAHRMDYVERLGRYRELFASAAALVVVSRAMERQLLALGAPPEKVVYNCYGIDVGRFAAGAPEQAPPHFVAVGRFVEKKAPQRTIAAFARALAQVPAARLTLVGQGPLWEDCAHQVQELGIGHAVDLCGVRTPDEIAALLRGARAFVQHSVRAANGDSEGTPLAVLEAMATGIPVIATRHTGIADVVGEEREGLLCEEHDVEGMARNLVRVALDPALAGRLGRAGRAKAEREHRVEDSIARLQAILERAARR